MDRDDHRLTRIALRAAAGLDLRAFLREALGGALELVGAQAGGAYVCRSNGQEAPEEIFLTATNPVHPGAEPAAASGREAADRRLLSLQNARKAVQQAGGEGAILSGWDLEREARNGPTEQRGKLLVVPLADNPSSTCLLILVCPSGREGFADADLDLCRGLARLLAPLLGNALRVRELEEMIVRDDIAGCYNRRHLEEFLSQETARARRFRTPLSLIFLDLDDLKSVNSAHGHNMGSQVLKEVARRVVDSTRRIDKLFRFGGDEFCIILPETDIEGALRVAERVRERISSRLFLEIELGAGVRLTASLGVATFPLHASSGEEMLAAADDAMRRIKGRGKNSVSVAEPLAPNGEKQA